MLQQESQGDAALTRLTLEAAVDPGKKPQQPVKGNSPLPLHRKICYAIGSAPYQLTNNALGFFFQLFLLDVVQLEPFLASLILFLGRVWDAVSDPVVGFLVGRSPRRRCGKFIPWIVGSTPFGVFFYFLLWLVPTDAPSVSLKLIWYLVMYCCFQTCMSCYHVSYSSLNMFLGGNQRERDSATAYRMSVEVLSTLVGSGIQGEIVGSHHANMRKTCDTENGTLANGTFLLTHMLENTRRSYMVASVVLGSLYCISCLVLFLGVKEQTGPLSPLGKSKIPFFKSLRIILSHRPYIWLLGSFLSASLAFQLAQGIFAFFCTHAAGLPDSFPYLVLILLVYASRCSGRLQALQSHLPQPGNLFLFLLCVLQQVCRGNYSWRFDNGLTFCRLQSRRLCTQPPGHPRTADFDGACSHSPAALRHGHVLLLPHQ
ncbi:sodium-dependent lysophosphatidylcholine symporter 1-B-like isoform X4 [Eublepharis macularius]|uniref:Sodium-dependent lysophosphatidylcholine symporter 1-B-like isoform X4 n=1 Tax=Eublepharis macularius TaxID=481883 RepID=A0AA97JF52_EUBMA|nr:sodium-dependent lysophosphatidylcholine symporter 1-B-like isoform X4 [Eublepharis macularius]XP_054836580.1 sodium-dependent lysophosphatidylcholine symporter 1-B-like isoform X4 [Eublepharis macularius]